MHMKLFPEVKKITRRFFADERGFFQETFREGELPVAFVQDNHSFSKKDVIRGIHFQRFPGQAKLIIPVKGVIFDVVVDVREESPTFGKWEGVLLDAALGEQLWIPVGFGHGFCVISDEGAHVCYKVSALYDPKEEKGFRYDDPFVGIEWPCKAPLLSERDLGAPLLQEVLACGCG
jgi:dTDP-4-dehydrorhamnose 3,5-epimerase